MVVFRLALLCVLVGVILKVLGLDPLNIIKSIEELVRYVWNMGFDAVVWLWRYFLLGAVIVIPIWLIVRLIRTPEGTVKTNCPTARNGTRRATRMTGSRRRKQSTTPADVAGLEARRADWRIPPVPR